MKKKLIIPIMLLSLAGGFVFYTTSHRQQTAEALIRISGNMEVTDIEASFKIPGHVVEREVAEGESVQKGQILARLDTVDLKHEVALRQAELEVARSNLADLEAGYRAEEIGQAKAVLDVTKAELERSERDWRRQRELFEKQVISERETEASKAVFEMAKAKAQEASEKLALLNKGFRPEQIASTRARVRQAEEALALAETRFGYATLTAPTGGVVLTDNIEPGEFVAAGMSVVTLGNLDTIWLRGYINETDLGRVKLGQQARVIADTWPGKHYQGIVSFISSEAEFTPKQVQTEKERVKLVYRIKIDVDNPHWELKPGMPADAEILIASTPESSDERH